MNSEFPRIVQKSSATVWILDAITGHRVHTGGVKTAKNSTDLMVSFVKVTQF
jgi:hypothetical protein